MATMTSYDLKGQKDSFANWISNLSPVDTFFVSTTKKEQVTNTLFQWQTDGLVTAAKNAQVEGETVAIGAAPKSTVVHDNVTQILRKAVEVSDTADALDNWGRGKELAYQMEKAGKEIKRDLEFTFLRLDTAKKPADSNAARETASFGKLCAGKSAQAAANVPDMSDEAAGIQDPDTKAKTHKFTGTAGSMTEGQVFDITYNLYLVGSDADTIMFHPKHATFFSSMMETGNGREKLIANMDTTLNKFVGSLIDPLGQQYKLVPNRYMPDNVVYFFNPSDWTQMVLRTPEKVVLAKKGSTERHMIEMEVGLRHKNPFASGILELTAN
ncbi:MAG: SU10 major capsid protein [Bacteroidales bacterium]